MNILLERNCTSPRQPNPRKLPPCLRSKEIPVARTDMPLRRDAASAPQHHLPAHELAVVLPQCPSQGLKPRIPQIGASRPFPAIAKHLPRPIPVSRNGNG